MPLEKSASSCALNAGRLEDAASLSASLLGPREEGVMSLFALGWRFSLLWDVWLVGVVPSCLLMDETAKKEFVVWDFH